MSQGAVLAGLIIFAYLLGSIPFGLLIGKRHGIDIREYGSGSTGATNVLRTLGPKAGIPAFIADVAKGVIPVLIARFVLGFGGAEVAVAVAAIAGHNWSIYLRFHGGRGVATSLGGLAAMSSPLWALAPMCLVVFIIAIASSRYVSIGSMAASVSVLVAIIVLVALGWVESVYLIYGIVGTGLVVLQHRSNIARLLAGTEHKLGEKGRKRE